MMMYVNWFQDYLKVYSITVASPMPTASKSAIPRRFVLERIEHLLLVYIAFRLSAPVGCQDNKRYLQQKQTVKVCEPVERFM